MTITAVIWINARRSAVTRITPRKNELRNSGSRTWGGPADIWSAAPSTDYCVVVPVAAGGADAGAMGALLPNKPCQ